MQQLLSCLHAVLLHRPRSTISPSHLPYYPPPPPPATPRSKLAAEGLEAPDVAQAQMARRAASTCRQHDHLGSPAFLEQVEGNPDLLLPHLQQLSLAEGQ